MKRFRMGASLWQPCEVGLLTFCFFLFFFVSRFKKRGITTLRGGVLGIVAPVRSGSLSLARMLWCFAISFDCCDTQAFWLSGWNDIEGYQSSLKNYSRLVSRAFLSPSGDSVSCLFALPFGCGNIDRGRLLWVRHRQMSGFETFLCFMPGWHASFLSTESVLSCFASCE